MFGLTVEEASPPPAEVWPDTEAAVRMFMDVCTQWRVGPTGAATGLDYAVLTTVFRMRGVPRSKWSDLFDDLRVMERAALLKMRA